MATIVFTDQDRALIEGILDEFDPDKHAGSWVDNNNPQIGHPFPWSSMFESHEWEEIRKHIREFIRQSLELELAFVALRNEILSRPREVSGSIVDGNYDLGLPLSSMDHLWERDSIGDLRIYELSRKRLAGVFPSSAINESDVLASFRFDLYLEACSRLRSMPSIA